MKKYGIDNVRGGPWCGIKLDSDEIRFIKKLIQSENDECYQCGSKNHFAKDCTKKKISKKISKKFYNEPIWECEFCNKEFDSLKGCKFHENIHCTKRRGMKWKKGERVKLSGLKKNGTNLNNQIAIINSFNSDKGKYTIQLIGRKNLFNVKPINIYKFDPAHALFDELKDSSDEEYSDEEYSDEEYLSDDYYYKQTNYTCFRCGRKGHMANNCFANKHIKGYNLSY